MRVTLKTVPDHYLDITSDICPITFVKTKLLIEKISPGEIIQVRLGEGEPIENVPRSVKAEGHEVISMVPDEKAEGIHILTIRKKNFSPD
jgi:TusA-related sulfurtransferase